MPSLRFFARVCVLLSLSLAGWAQPRLAFNATTQDLGQVPENNGPVTHRFTFTNTGTQPVTITNARASCGCTVPQWPNTPIAPGATGEIVAEFNPKNRVGFFNKTITVTSNHDGGAITLAIKGTVIPGGTEEAKPAEFVQHFDYNNKKLDLTDARFQQFIKALTPLIKAKGKVTLTVESSASEVPTKTYKSNLDLTRDRAREARDKIRAALLASGIKAEQFSFAPDRTLVQGPKYNNDFDENADLYQRYQYVKVTGI